jgi:hypothetical protein
MKASSKSPGGIKGMFLAHGEKLGMVLVAVAALFLVYKALQQQSLDASHQPNELERLVTEAKGTVEKADFASAPPENIRTYKEIAKVGEGTIPEKAYRASVNWNPPVVPPTVLRKDPELLAAQKLEANGGSGLLAFTNDDIRRQRALEEQQAAERKEKEQQKEAQKEADQSKSPRSNTAKHDRSRGDVDPEHPNRRLVTGMARPAGIPLAGDEEVRTAYWAVVLAKVPIKEEYKIFRDAFENARGYDPQYDFPKYMGYYVERAEVPTRKDESNPTWQPVSVYNGRGDLIGPAVARQCLYGSQSDSPDAKGRPGVVTNWAAPSEEVVDPRYLDSDGLLAFPLPPMVGHDWGSEVTHSDIPLASAATPEDSAAASDADAAKQAADKPADKPANPMDIFSGGSADSGPPNRMPGGMSRDREMGGSRDYGRRSQGYSMPGGRGEGREGYVAGSRGGAPGTTADAAPQEPYWLLRFFDFNVEPGKKYIYRVMLVMQDPNQTSPAGRYVSLDYLDSKVIQRIKEKKQGPFRRTAWSDPSPVVSIPLAGGVRVAAAKPASERLNDEPSTTLLVESFGSDDKGKATRAAKEKDFKRGSVANMTEDAEILVDQGRAIDPMKSFPFHTGITVLDIEGGDPLAKDIKKPARVLLMDQAGQLFVQNETDDANAVELHRDLFTDADKQPRGRPGAAPSGRENPRGPSGFQPGFGGRGGGGER